MEFYDLKINGRDCPMGISFSRVVCSWKVRDVQGKKQKKAKIEVSLDNTFQTLLYQIENADLNSLAQPLQLCLKPRTRYYWRVFVETEEGEHALSEPTYFETGKIDEPWKAIWITTNKEDSFHPEFRKNFSIRAGWDSARLYISGVGLFEAMINGNKVGDDYLSPFCNDYRDGVQYCTYDVTEDLQIGNNILSVILGNGWYKGRLGYEGLKEVYGNQFQMIAELHIHYQDGEEIIASDQTWEYHGSSIVWSDIYDGECQDQLLWEKQDNPWRKAVESQGDRAVERYSLPLRTQETFAVKQVIYTPAGEMVLDFGQNFAGFVEFNGEMEYGKWLKLEFGEILQDGNFYRDNYRTAKACFQYRSDGIRRKIRPHFTYYGFRYVKVECECEVDKEDFCAKAVYSAVKRTGWFTSSSSLLNRLYQNTVWGLKSNFVDMPTDCPQRDERLGWTGDAQIFGPTASFHMDTRAFYEKYLIDLRKDQIRNQGKVAMYLPNLQPHITASVWGDAATILPMMLYHYYGDKELLREEYPLMQAWIEYVHGEDMKHGKKHLWNFGFHLGDWLALDGTSEKCMIGATDPFFISSVYYFHSAMLTSEAAEILEKLDDAKKYRILADGIKEQILYHYFTPSGKLAVDTQTAYYICLAFGVYRSRKIIIEDLKKRLKKDGYQIKSGFVGAPVMCNILAEAGLVNLAYDFLFGERYPGWMYEVKMGATTIWERWNSVLPNGKISDTGMNSLNHYAYGSVAEFLYKYVAGLQGLSPGYRTVRIAPQFSSYLTWMECKYDSAIGTYYIYWKILENKEVQVRVQIPFGAKAILILPEYEGGIQELESGTYQYQYKTKQDYQYRYQKTSRLEQIVKDKEAVTVLKNIYPELYQMLQEGNCEILLESLDELKNDPRIKKDKEKIDQVASKIMLLKGRKTND